ncbi:MAG: FixH family protein [Nitrospirae bacterium]|nr:FixH family protein [Nitrospirota bacterium]
MKNVVLGIVLVLLVAGTGFAKNLEVEKKAGDYTLKITMDNNPPIVGDNNITVEVKDSTGKSVTDAKVMIDYSMPAMPGMPAMNYKTDAKYDAGTYKAVMTLSMAGSWNISVKVAHSHKRVKAKINVDAK